MENTLYLLADIFYNTNITLRNEKHLKLFYIKP